MKKISVFLILLVVSSQAFAQETVVPKTKKLQQLYLSVGTGPAINRKEVLHSHGGNFDLNVTTSLCGNNLLRVGFKQNSFAGTFDPETTMFSYLDLDYNTYYIPSTHLKSGQLLAGKRKLVNRFIQVQALAGFSFNQITQPDRYPTFAIETMPPIWDYRLVSSYKPGAILQAEAMFLPTCFAGLTLGGYYHYVPKISNAGLTLSLNLGLLK